MNSLKERLIAIKHKQIEAVKLNNKAIVEEDRIKSLPYNYVKKQERIEKQMRKLEAEKELKEQGRDYAREQSLNYTAEECERWMRKKRKHYNVNEDSQSLFTNCDRQYYRLTKQIKPDINKYNEQKAKMKPEDFYAASNSLVHGTHKASSDAIEKIVNDLNSQELRRQKSSRRRIIDLDADIDYINERNRVYNQKIDRFFGKYTAEIKQNLERGTAV
ncbi:hypothetical protein GJ496_011897 [Pomphorhynchus laevis]|nr:hypothetical protein GJ496_011897 [Pomphorhynchus laevis]